MYFRSANQRLCYENEFVELGRYQKVLVHGATQTEKFAESFRRKNRAMQKASNGNQCKSIGYISLRRLFAEGVQREAQAGNL